MRLIYGEAHNSPHKAFYHRSIRKEPLLSRKSVRISDAAEWVYCEDVALLCQPRLSALSYLILSCRMSVQYARRHKKSCTSVVKLRGALVYVRYSSFFAIPFICALLRDGCKMVWVEKWVFVVSSLIYDNIMCFSANTSYCGIKSLFN
jgi:hypothetical protein